MRLASIALLAALPLLAACDSSTPPAKSASTAPAATTAPVARPAAPASFPLNARPMLGTWGVDAAQCEGNAIVVTTTSYSVGSTSAELTLTDYKDGTFTTSVNGKRLALTPIFGPPGEGIRIAEGDAKPVNVFRCNR